ncbi:MULTISPECIES: hypothetical protein [Prolixibacter]|uniref:Lipoprotein n=1 Tax=Prolixibacter denitrificans TaxID=1541063 RepID=A0A2P8CI33_9BACT|nr:MULTISPECIES: hypothetical protein [Prolixibacter]PSK84635.1 hypothetical protein CLV93_102425 [Prolixibacter denitrificans]GET20801.1 hypothetical protein JCM18694_10470 [Prolixibacter denitrificans]GET27445.1 hypothetical protein NT017_37740 [Prolixibacter sp. NT017]
MRISLFIILFATLGGLASCHRVDKKAAQTEGEYLMKLEKAKAGPQDTTAISAEEFQKKFSWVKEGTEGYAAVTAPINGHYYGRPIKARVIRKTDRELKLRFLESVMVAPAKNCPAEVKSGQTYWEKRGAFWKTREEAKKYLAKHGWLGE